MAFSYDPARTAQVSVPGGVVTVPGNRIRSVMVGSQVVVRNGAIVGEPGRLIRMVTLKFLADGGSSYPFGPVAGQTARSDLVTSATAATGGGRSSFSAPGTEQDALGEFLQNLYKTTPYSVADVPESQDLRIQNISVRTDTVLP